MTAEDELQKRIAELEQIIEQRAVESQTSQVLFHAFLNNLPAIAWTKDLQGFFTFANREFEQCYQTPAMALVGRSVFDLLPKESAEEVWAAEMALLETGQAAVTEEVIDQPVGGLRHKFVTRFPIRGPGGSIQGLGGILIDITEQKQASRALRESRERFEDLIERGEDWVWETDVSGTFTYASPQIATLLGYTPEEVLGKTVLEFMPPEEVERVKTILLQGLEARKPIHQLESLKRRKDGSQVVVETSGVPFYDAEGQFKGYRGIDRDITARKHEQAEREQLQQQVIEAQRRALQELSTPIIPIMDRIIVMPLVGSIDTMRSKDIMRALLSGISEYRAKVVIIDITGVPIVDSGVAGHLDKTIQAARLKGARTIITGVSDAVAETIVDLGIDWSGVETLRDLQTGLLTALQSLGIRLSQ